MSFFKKWFAEKFSKAKDQEKVERPVRVRVSELHKLTFLLKWQGETHKLAIANISTGGIGFFNSSLFKPARGQLLEGELVIKDVRFFVRLQIRHISTTLFGCQLLEINEVLKELIEEYFRLEIIGMSLKRVSDEFLRADEDGQPVWFTDGKQNELYYTINPEQKIQTFHLGFLGHYIEGGREQKLRTGQVLADPSHADRSRLKGATLIRFNNTASASLIEHALTLIQNLEELSVAHREQLQVLMLSPGQFAKT